MTAASGWWAIDVAAYFLGRLEELGDARVPLVPDDARRWINETELVWASGTANPSRDVPWEHLGAVANEVDLACLLLGEAANEALIRTDAGLHPRPGSVSIAARRRLPLTTLRAVSDSVRYSVEQPDVTDLLASGCADGHVHQGAALPLEVVMHWVAAAGGAVGYLSEAQRRLPWLTVDGTRFRPEPLLYLLQYALTSDGADLTAVRRLAAEAAGEDETAWGRLRDRGPLPTSSDVPTVEEIVDMKRALLADAPERFLAVIRAETVLHSAVTQRTPGLDLFVRLFDDMSSLRRSATATSGRVAYMTRSIEQHAEATPQLTGLELRFGTAVLRPGGGIDTRGLDGDISTALRGYLGYLAKGRSLKASFPLSFVKTGAVPSRHWRFDAHALYRTTENVVALLTRVPSLGPFLDGLDVCGLEESAPLWVFAPAYERVARWAAAAGTPLAFRVHAGEFCFNPVQGLRAIDDFLDMRLDGGVSSRRIGHALTLGSDDWVRLPDEPAFELLDDLVWAWVRLAGVPSCDDLLRQVARVTNDYAPLILGDLAAEIEGAPDDRAVLWEAYRLRTNREFLVRIGMLEPLVRGGLAFVGGPPRPGRDLVDRLAGMALCAGDIHKKHARDFDDVAERASAVLRDAYELLRDGVLKRILDAGAVIEVCPTSNVLTGGVRGYRQHPVRLLRDRKIPFTVNSDDPTLFHVFVGEEVARVAEALGDIGDHVVARGRALVAPRLDAATVQQQVADALRLLDRGV